MKTAVMQMSGKRLIATSVCSPVPLLWFVPRQGRLIERASPQPTDAESPLRVGNPNTLDGSDGRACNSSRMATCRT